MTAVPDSPLIIIYAVTQDNFDGSPWPPDGNDFWSVVRRTNNFTTWRHVTLDLNSKTSPAPEALDASDGNKSSSATCQDKEK